MPSEERGVRVEPYGPGRREEILALSLRAWRPVFAELRPSVPGFVHDAFYPQDWEERQIADVARILDEEPGSVRVAVEAGTALGWVCVRLHPADRMGEVHVLAVDPPHQRRGHGDGHGRDGGRPGARGVPRQLRVDGVPALARGAVLQGPGGSSSPVLNWRGTAGRGATAGSACVLCMDESGILAG